MKPKLFAAGLAGIVLAAGLAQAFEIASDQQIDGASPQIVGVGAGNTVTPSGAAPNWIYNWADRDGDGSSNAVATAGLDLGAFKLFTAVTDSRGTITLDLNGGNIVGHDGVGIITYHSDGNLSDNLEIRNVGDIAMGGIDTHAQRGSTTARAAGSVVIGSETQPAGHIRLAYLHAHGEGSAGAAQPTIVIHGGGDVLIEDSEGNLGDVRGESQGNAWNHVYIYHVGHFRARNVNSWCRPGNDSYSHAGHITLDGGNSSGDCLISEDILAYYMRRNYGGLSHRQEVTISRYRNVMIGNIRTDAVTGGGTPGGHVTIADGITGDITITGSIDMRHSGDDIRYYGTLKLAAGGTVTLAGLDLGHVESAHISSGSGRSTIEGELLNFDTTGSGSGSLNNPVVTTQTALRVPNGQRLLYKVRDGANAGLEGKVYRIANENGQAGTGGLLMPIPTRGTVLMFF